MRNFVLLASIAASGVLFVPDEPDVTAEIAIEASLDQFREKNQRDSCENCRGTGKIGDGRIVYDCPVCKGTGKSCGESCRRN